MGKTLLGILARDPVPEEKLFADQVSAHRRAALHLRALEDMGEIQIVDDPSIFVRHEDEKVSFKAVPSIKELVFQAQQQAKAPAAFYGFINADVILSPTFLGDLREAKRKEQDTVILHRTDVDNLSEVSAICRSADPHQMQIGRKVNPGNSADGILFSKEALSEFLSTFPDFAVGEPWWDTAAIYWARHSRFSVRHMAENQALHVKHPQAWSFSSPGARRAHELYIELISLWPED